MSASGLGCVNTHMSVQILKSFTFVPQPKFNGDPLLIKRERCLITDGPQSRLRKFEQVDKWSFCLTAGTLMPANQERR